MFSHFYYSYNYLKLLLHEINFTKSPYENYQNTDAGWEARCDKQKWGIEKRFYTGVSLTTNI